MDKHRFVQLLADHVRGGDDDDFPDSPDGISHAMSTACAVLQQLGVNAQMQNAVITLGGFTDPADDRICELSAAEAEQLTELHETLRSLDPDFGVQNDLAVFGKSHLHETVEITYGAETYVGLVAWVDDDRWERTALVLHTDDGARAFFADAIATLTVVSPDRVSPPSAGDDVELVVAAPVGRPALKHRKGRRSDPATLRQAQRLVGAIRSATRTDNDEVQVADLLAITGETKATNIRNLGDAVQALDPRIMYIPDDDAYWFDPNQRTPGPAWLTGAEALVHRLEIAALRSLDCEVPGAPSGEALVTLTHRLDEFLSKIDLTLPHEAPPCGENLVHATLDHYPIGIRQHDESAFATLKHAGLRWDRGRWWVMGQLDRHQLEVGELALASVVETSEAE